MKRTPAVMIALSLGLLIGFQTGCAGPRGLAEGDPWLAPPPANVKLTPGTAPIDPSIVRPVLEPQDSAAEERLAAASWVHITPDEAEHLAGWTNAPSGTEGDLYLIRGVTTLEDGAAGALGVYPLPRNDLLVRYEATSHVRQHVIRQPLVVWLESPPSHVYLEINVPRK